MNKSKIAYYRKLYLAFLINLERHNLVSLEEKTGMPKRTIQTAMSGLSDIGIEHEFVQDGPKNRQGYYKITEWADHNPKWIKSNLQYVIDVLQ